MRFERISGTWLEITNVQETPNLSSKQILQTVESMQSKPTLSNRQTWDGHAKVISGTRLEIPNYKLMIFELSYPCSPKQHYQINKHGMEMLLWHKEHGYKCQLSRNSKLIIKNKFFEPWNLCNPNQHCPVDKHARNVECPGNSKLIIKNKFFELWNPCSPEQHCPIHKHARNVKCAGNFILIIKNKSFELWNRHSPKQHAKAISGFEHG